MYLLGGQKYSKRCVPEIAASWRQSMKIRIINITIRSRIVKWSWRRYSPFTIRQCFELIYFWFYHNFLCCVPDIFLISFIKHFDLVENHISVSESISQRIKWLYTRRFIFSTLDENDKKKHKNRKSMVPFTSFIQISESLPATAYLQ